MDIASAIFAPVVKSLMDLAKKNIGYLISCTKNVTEMKDKIDELNHKKNDVQAIMVNFNLNKLHIPSRVPSWLEEVEAIKAEVERFPRDVGSSNLKDKHKYGKKAFKVTERINRLIDDANRINWSDHKFPAAVVSMKASTSEPSRHRNDSKVPTPSICDDNEFQSRKQTFTEALEALESDDKPHMVALCGMRGVGKTTMMEKLKKVVIERKIFDFVIKAVIGERANTIAIQQVVAAYLGLDLAGGDRKTRAIKLRECFKAYSDEGKKFLVVLEDVWQPLDLNDIGLSHLPNEGGVNFKVLMTSRNRHVCIEMGVEFNSILNVEVLTDEEAQNFFLQLVTTSKDLDLDLRKIGDEIARRCHGVPLDIKTMTFILRGKRKEVWKDALSRLEHHDPFEFLAQIFERGYNNLHNQETRSTLLLCGLFPEDFDIPKEDLVRYAWGLNLFRNVDTIREARDRLNIHIERLIDATFLIKSQDVGCVKMRGLVLGFLLYMCSKAEHALIVGNLSKWPAQHTSESCKQISLTCTGGMSEFPRDFKYPNLLLLKLTNGDQSLRFHDEFYQEMGKLKVLAYEEMSCQVTSRSLRCSTNLRTLCFHRCSGTFDLSPIGDLFNLEVLSFAHCGIRELPSAIGNLEKLKLLDLTGCINIRIDDGVLKKLVKLEELYMRHSGIPNEKVNNLREVNGDELATCSENLDALEIEFLDSNGVPKGMSFNKLTRFKIALGCSLEEEEEEDRKNWHSFENTLMLVTNKDQLLEFRINELFETTEVLHLQVGDVRDGLVESFYPRRLSFYSLRVLQIVKCVDLRYLFTVRVANGLTKLERLTVSLCPVLGTLLIDSENSGVEAIRFQSLKFLSLGKLPNLMSFCNKINAIELPQLEELILDSLLNFTSIYPDNKSRFFSMSNDTSAMQSFPNKEIVISELKKMKIRKMENLKVILRSQSSGREETYTYLRKETYVDSDPNTIFPDDPDLWECSVEVRHIGRLFGFGTDQDHWFAMTGDPSASSSGSLYGNRLLEIDALKEKMASYEERLGTEQRNRAALEQQHKETTNELTHELTRQKALIEQLFAFMRQFQGGNPPPTLPPL